MTTSKKTKKNVKTVNNYTFEKVAINLALPFPKRTMLLLNSAFPPEELYNLANYPFAKAYPSYAYYLKDEDKDIGLAITIGKEEDEFVYLGFLMVSDSYRNQGLGSYILSHIKKDYPNIFLDIEPLFDNHPDIEMRQKRLAFYERNGIYPTNVTYTLINLPWHVLATKKDFNEEDFTSFWKKLNALPIEGFHFGF